MAAPIFSSMADPKDYIGSISSGTVTIADSNSVNASAPPLRVVVATPGPRAKFGFRAAPGPTSAARPEYSGRRPPSSSQLSEGSADAARYKSDSPGTGRWSAVEVPLLLEWEPWAPMAAALTTIASCVLQQADYAVKLAARRYHAVDPVDPDNRLVASELEARWNDERSSREVSRGRDQDRGSESGDSGTPTAKPLEYLRDVLLLISTHAADRIDELLPDRWNPAESP
jgi:hypothetical protein